MKTRLLIIIASFLVLIPWAGGLEFGINNEVMVDGFTISAITVMILTLSFSMTSWFLLSCASKNISIPGILLSIITGASLVIPFLQVLGPMAGVIVGVVAGFAAFMLQKKMTNPLQTKPLKIAFVTIAATYFVLIVMVLATQTHSIWDTGDGIGEWTGTAEGMERAGFASVLGSDISFAFFLVIPVLVITGLIIQDKKNIQIKIILVVGIALIIEGFFATIYSAFVLFPPTEPPMMRPLEGMDYLFFIHRQAFMISGIVGIFVTIAGIIFWRKRK
ncbi:MAG: hypothetical protein ACW9W4_07905 [Candidatus Nitrosopumilus sp. bin_7KS]